MRRPGGAEIGADEGGDHGEHERGDDHAMQLAHAAEHDERQEDRDPLPLLGREEGEDEADQRAGGAGEPEADAEGDRAQTKPTLTPISCAAARFCVVARIA